MATGIAPRCVLFFRCVCECGVLSLLRSRWKHWRCLRIRFCKIFGNTENVALVLALWWQRFRTGQTGITFPELLKPEWRYPVSHWSQRYPDIWHMSDRRCAHLHRLVTTTAAVVFRETCVCACFSFLLLFFCCSLAVREGSSYCTPVSSLGLFVAGMTQQLGKSTDP